MFRTNNCSSSGDYFCTRNIEYFMMQVHGKTLCFVYKNNHLMTNSYLFETCGGYFNWNKLTRKSVHLVGFSCILF